MWIPSHQRVDDADQLWSMLERESFGSLICADDDGVPLSTQAPFIHRQGRLWVHLAAANPHANLLADGRPVLCQFLGPHAYVSSSWYKDDIGVGRRGTT